MYRQVKAARILHHPALRSIVQEARKESISLYLVGGVVRSRLIQPDEEVEDVDLLMIGDVQGFANRIADLLNSKSIVINKSFNTVLVPARKINFEISNPKTLLHKEHTTENLPENPITRDLLLRDFTMNALAQPLSPKHGKLFDPSGGRNDMEKRLIRTPISPDVTLKEDPLRLLRAARFAAQLNFAITPELLKAMHEQRQLIATVSTERKTAELLKLLSAPKPSIGLKLLYMTGILDCAFPEVASLAGLEQNKRRHHKDVFEHTLKVLDTVAEEGGALPTRIAALLHDIGKPATRRYDAKLGWTFHGHEVVGERMVKKLGRNWKLPSSIADTAAKLVRLHMRPINLSDEGVTDSAVRRLGAQAGADIDDLITLCRADVTSSDPRRVKRYLANFEKVVTHLRDVEEKDELRSFQSPVRGDVIMAETGLEPGPKVGEIKKMIEEAILDGHIPNEFEAALKYLRKIKDEVVNSDS